MSGRTTAHPTGDHWIAPQERSLFGTPPPTPNNNSGRTTASSTDDAFEALRAAAEAAAAVASEMPEDDDAPDLTLVHGHEGNFYKEAMSLLHELTEGQVALQTGTVTPHTSPQNDGERRSSLLKMDVRDLIGTRRHEVAS